MTSDVSPTPGRSPWPFALALFAATFALFAGALGHDFVDYDDSDYVLENPLLEDGLTPATVGRVFTRAHAANWHPLTWLSHALDVTLFGFEPAGHHATSLLLHAASAALLFLLLARAVGDRWTAFALAALWAWYPLRVESVAWVSERKDVLAGFFALLCLWRYARWVATRTTRDYVLVALALACGLMAKPMLVTLPVLLLLVDRWPLAREGWHVKEKLPLFALVAAVVIVTLVTQTDEGATSGLATVGLSLRIENACAATGSYALQTLWPVDLAVFYPHPQIFGESRLGVAILSALVGLLLAVLAWRSRERAPWFGVGLAWFVIALLPVLGFVQVGLQAQADRYTYLPSIGLTLAIGLGVRRWARNLAPHAGRVALGAVLLVLGFATWRQVAVWRDTETLFSHAARVTERNFVAWDKLGRTRTKRGDVEGAIIAFENGLALQIEVRSFLEQLAPLYVEQAFASGGHAALEVRGLPATMLVDALSELGRRELAAGRAEDALASYRAALAYSPEDPISHFNVGAARQRLGDTFGARSSFARALELDPSFDLARERIAAIDAAAPPRPPSRNENDGGGQ